MASHNYPRLVYGQKRVIISETQHKVKDRILPFSVASSGRNESLVSQQGKPTFDEPWGNVLYTLSPASKNRH